MKCKEASQNLTVALCKWAVLLWREKVGAKQNPSLPLIRSVKRAAGWMPVCSHALCTTMALSHSPQQAAVPLRWWVNTMVSKYKHTSGIYLLFDSPPPITSWEPLPCGCEVVGATAAAPIVKLNFHTDQPETNYRAAINPQQSFSESVWQGGKKTGSS